jgi:amino acid transporter
MAFVYAELGSAFPLSGGEYAIVARVVGRFAGFITMGIFTVLQMLVPAVLALGISTYLAALYPNLPAVPTAMVTIALATAVSILTVRVNAVVTGIFLAIEVLALIVLAGLGFLHMERSLADLALHPVMLSSTNTLISAPYAMIGMATSISIYAYNGYSAAVYFGEETHQPERHVAHAVLWALGIAIVTELVPLTAVLLGAPDLKALLNSSNMFGDFITVRAGSLMNAVISLGIALAIFNAIIAIQLCGARVIFSTGRDQVWPRAISAALALTHKRFHSPWVAALVCGACSILACLAKENVLLIVTGSELILIMSLLCVAALVGRWRRSTSHGFYRMPCFPLAPIAALLMMLFVVYASWLDPVIGRPGLFVSLGVMVLFALYYLPVNRRSGGWVLRGPSD